MNQTTPFLRSWKRAPRELLARARILGSIRSLVLLRLLLPSARQATAGSLEDLAKPHEGRSMRATSTMRVGEVRRNGERKLDPKAEPRGDLDEQSNWDNYRVPAGETHVLLDEQGPGVITHIWMTFLGPEPQGWANGKNSQSQGYYAGIESVRLRERRPRVAAMAHDKDKDWRKTPTLYQ